MKIELASQDISPIVRQIVKECFREIVEFGKMESRPKRREMDEAESRLLLSSAEAAKLLSISERTLWELKRTGELPYVAIGNGGKRDSVRYAVADLEALIAKRKSTAANPGTINQNPPES